MNLLIVDDEFFLLENCRETVETFDYIDEIYPFTSPSKALEFASSHAMDIHGAILDIEMPTMSGLDLAKALHNLNPQICIIFLTSYSNYALDAFGVDAIDYILKPFSDKTLDKALHKILTMFPETCTSPVIRIQTFGGFDIYINDVPVHFPRKKSKELLALLVDKRGNSITLAQAISYMWEDSPLDNKLKENYKKNSYVLKQVLKNNNIAHILNDNYNSLSINVNDVSCDYYDFLAKKDYAIRLYNNNYMPEYSWAEETNGSLYYLKDLQ